MSGESKLDFELVLTKFESCLSEKEGDTIIKLYIEGYEELCKFFTLMGTIFNFVNNDLVAKMEIMKQLMSKNPEQFYSVSSMMEYEKKNDLLNKKGYVSGSRTLLRLHRGLNFIKEFLKGVCEIENDQHTNVVCRKAYDATLAEYHPFIVRTGAKVAMSVMPTRENLLKTVINDNPQEIEKVMITVPKVLDVLNNVFDTVNLLYTQNVLHNLP